MTTKELRTELVETRDKIRTMNEALKVLRARHTELKTRLSEARAAKNAQRDGQ
jgi:phage shock protein A